MPAPIVYGLAVAAVALANWACGGGSRPSATDTRPPTPKLDSGNPEDADGGAGFPRPDAQTPDSFVPDSVDARPDIRDVYIPPDAGPGMDTGLSDIGFTDFGLDAGTPDLGIMDAGRPPCNPTNLEALDGYDDNCNGNNNALAEMKRINIEFDGLNGGVLALALGNFMGNGLGDIAVGYAPSGVVYMIKGSSFTLQEGITFHLVWNQNRFGLDATPRGGMRAPLPNTEWKAIHRSYMGDPTGLGTSLAVVRVRDQRLGIYRNELWIGAGALNNAWWPSGDGLESGGILRFDAFQSTMHEYIADHTDLLNPVYLQNNHMWLIKGEDRIPTPMMNAQPGSQLGSEIIPAGDVNGFANGADEVVLPYFQQKKVAIVSALTVTQPSQRIQTLASLQPGQGHFFDGGIHFGLPAKWAFGDIDNDGRNDMCVGNPGAIPIDLEAGRVVCMTHLENLPFRSDPFNVCTLHPLMRVWTFLGLPNGSSSGSGSSLGDSLAMGDFDGDGHADIAAGAVGLNHITGGLYTLKGIEVLNSTANSTITLSGPAMGGRLYNGQSSMLGEGFTGGGIVSVDMDGDRRADFVAGTTRRSQTGQPPFVGGADLICSRSMTDSTLMPTNEGSIAQNADERIFGENGVELRFVNQNATYDLNNDGAQEIGMLTNQASCIIFVGSR